MLKSRELSNFKSKLSKQTGIGVSYIDIFFLNKSRVQYIFDSGPLLSC